MLRRPWLNVYAALFAAAGLLFLVAPHATLALLAWAARAPAPRRAPPSLWLGLTGSLMAVLTLAAWELSRDPGQDAVWRLLLLAKAVSAALFVDFALLGGGRAFLLAAGVDGAILLHLLLLRGALEPLDPWGPRRARHEAWFLTLRDPATGAAFWLRHAVEDGAPSTWWAVTDPRAGMCRRGRWEGAGSFTRGAFSARGSAARWELSWDEGPVPAYALVPRWLWWLSGAGYLTAAPAARFTGWFESGGRRWELTDAPGCVGRVWGRRRGAGWRWAHAWLPEKDALVEVLLARGPLGVSMAAAAVWREGKLSVSAVLGATLAGGVEPPGWSFSVPLDGGALEGVCHAPPALVMEAVYGEGPERVVCRHATAGSLAASWRRGVGEPEWDVVARGTAAVEAAEPG